MDNILTCNIGERTINCFDGSYSKDELKKWSSKNILKCPVCNKTYEYCHGQIAIPYFRHKDKVECNYKYCEPETGEHLKGKRDIYKWLVMQKNVTEVTLEAWLPDTHQRPDIMFKCDGDKYVIEYQCSPIATEYFERHALYQAAGIHDIWICGTEKFLQSNMRIKTLENYCAGYYDSKNKHFIFNYQHQELEDVIESTTLKSKVSTNKCFYKQDLICHPILLSDIVLIDGNLRFKYVFNPHEVIRRIYKKKNQRQENLNRLHNSLFYKYLNAKDLLQSLFTSSDKYDISIIDYKLCRDNRVYLQFAITSSTPWGIKREYYNKYIPVYEQNSYYRQLCLAASEIIKARNDMCSEICHITEAMKTNKDLSIILGFATRDRIDKIAGTKSYQKYFYKQFNRCTISSYDFVRDLTFHINKNSKNSSNTIVAFIPSSLAITSNTFDLHRYPEDVLVKYFRLLGLNNVSIINDRDDMFKYIHHKEE